MTRSGWIRLTTWWSALTISAIVAGRPCALMGQLNQDINKLEGVGVVEHLGSQIPSELEFTDSEGRRVRVGRLFDGELPVILSLNYSSCPMLCRLQLNGLVNGLAELSLTPGEDYRIVSVSIDPTETTTAARQTKQRYRRAFGRPSADDGWSFLTGDPISIERLADAVGFKYRYLEDRQEYAHAAVVVVCSPQGRISRYLYGVDYPSSTLRLSLVEAGQGKIGTTLDRVLLFCFHYDATSGRYAPMARQVMKLGAAITLILLFGGLLPVWLRGMRKRAVKVSIHPTSMEVAKR